MSSGNDTAPQEFRAQDVASPRDLLPNRLRMIASALLASDQSFSSAMCVEAADRIEELEKLLVDDKDELTQILVTMETLGRRIGATFTVDPEKVKAFQAAAAARKARKNS